MLPLLLLAGGAAAVALLPGPRPGAPAAIIVTLPPALPLPVDAPTPERQLAEAPATLPQASLPPASPAAEPSAEPLPPLPTREVAVRPRVQPGTPREPAPWFFEGRQHGGGNSGSSSAGGGRQLGDVRVIGPTMLSTAGQPHSLQGVAPPAPDALCPTAQDAARRCTEAAMALLAARIGQHAPLRCAPRAPGIACTDSGGVDLGRLLVAEGLALPTPDSPAEYGVAESQARAAAKGLWAR
ncbi:thermonuclease family protein [Oceanibaculum pacificum]|uniref:TNase-like domain-containing protein n=1 Tax=Oceanibaculum pacificum TaxID=580166 RepID=A0A154VYR6_9PROT|nr:hypothetical protein [Oceanibaculum pacificum]KZD06405.1 hypothetical protein AUP43_10805 [Oceanibaculum pacificum]